MKKKLVVGGGGFIGSLVTEKLVRKNYPVKVLDKFIYRNKKAICDLSNLEIIEEDVRNIVSLHQAMKECDTVIYLAELVGDPACKMCPDLMFQVNHIAPCTAALIAKNMGIKHFIYTSSCSVYGVTKDSILTEESSLNPVSGYGRTKVKVENFIQSITDKKFQPTIFRLATVYGLSPRPRFDLVVNTITATAVVNKKITIMGGNEWRPFIHVEDVARAIALATELPLTIIGGKIFNLGSGENHQLIEIGEMVHTEVPEAIIKIMDKPNEDRRSYSVDTEKFKHKTRFKPIWNIPQAIKQLKKYLEKNPDWQSEEKSNILTMRSKKCQI